MDRGKIISTCIKKYKELLYKQLVAEIIERLKKSPLFIFRLKNAGIIGMGQFSPYHVVAKSPWPIFMSASIFITLLGIVLYFHYFILSLAIIFFGVFSILFFITRWFLDIIEESYKGHHTSYVANGLRIGFVLLIVSEVMFFFSFFWSYFHLTCGLSEQVTGLWPYVKGPFPWALPLLNTLILGFSSLTLTEAHLFFLKKNKLVSILFFFITILLGFFFSFIQALEYLDSPLTFNNGTCGSLFYMLTGFHGFHVAVGTIFLIVTLYRIEFDQFLIERHILLEVSSLYWHFVDVIWFFLFFFVYIWGGF